MNQNTSRHDPDELVILLTRGISQRKMYFPDHPRVKAVCRDFPQKMGEFLLATGKKSFFIGIVEKKLVYNGRYLVGPTIVGSRLTLYAEYLQCGGFLFQPEVNNREMSDFFSLAIELPEPPTNLVEARELLESRGIRNIVLSPVYEDPDHFGHQEDCADDLADESESNVNEMFMCRGLFDSVEDAHNSSAHDQSLDLDKARADSEQLLAGTRDGFMEIMQLVHYPDFDTYTVGHSVRVALLAVLVSRSLDLDQELALEFCLAALLHDVGKSRIPDEILYKPGRLSDEERHIMQAHASAGAEILMANEKAGPLAVAAAWGHHLRYDGGGYPPPPSWAQRNFLTSLLQVIDVFEALTAIRPYKPPYSPRRVFEIMVSDQGAFDPTAFTAFVQAVGLYPPGSRVILSDGSRGIVKTAGSHIEKPHVLLLLGSQGERFDPEERPTVDLSAAKPNLPDIVEMVL